MITKEQFRIELMRLWGSYTQRELAEMLGANPTSINHWISGKTTPKKKKMRVTYEKMQALR